MAGDKNTKSSIETILNPAGFIEQHYIGVQKASDVEAGVKKLNYYVKKLEDKKQPVYILIDITKVKLTFDREVHEAGIKGMRTVKFKRGALYGPLVVQVLINTLIRVAGVQKKASAFSDRTAAIKWLKGGS